ncbi:helix-turn-helix transcriptional regulator [Amycolatopsis sp. ATCC 39116]|uniref:helix-turn-helix transcriptional regulator n=1 Tax=Amycolatopsis sp. (strain ATCC 39116 / 75iv2) TaxID=385957 RepID=UPI0002627AB1|nr:helix-turn-helix transcriptional regulator [Amycolatopsis sp. ATCC 39116]
MVLVPRLGSGIPLVARADEMRRLRAAFTAAERGEAGAVLVSGDAGVGKTRLLTELSEHASSRGALVLSGRCLDVREGGLPYLPFAEALAPLSLDDDPVVAEAVRVRPALARLLPQGGAMPPSPAGEHLVPDTSGERDVPYRVRPEQDLGQLQLFDAVLGVLTQVAAHRPVVLVLEDLHWADSSSRNLLSFLLNRLRGQRLLVVGSYREEDVHRRHPLRAMLVELVRLPVVTHVELRPFGTAEARAFVEALADGPVTPEIVAWVAERSEGNPFFAEELMAAGVECEDLPAGLAEVLLSRLERLSPEARRVVRTISAAGDSVAHTALAEVTGLDELELDEALREAVHHHVLVIERGAYTFRHALLQEAVYADLLPGERVRMHAAYAERIRRTPQGRGHDAKLAYHSLRSRDLKAALPALLRAAEEAERLGAPGAALRHIEQALEIWDAVPEADRPEGVDELKLLQEASYFAATSGEPERAIAYGRSSVHNLRPGVPPEKAAKVWRRLAEVLLNAEGTLHEALDAINKAWDLVSDGEPSKTRAWVLATRAAILRNAGQYEDSRWNAHTAVADARAVGNTGAEAAALVTLGALDDAAGEPEEARARLEEAERKALDSGSLNVALRAVCFLAFSYEDLGEYGPAMDIYRRGIERAEQTGLTWSIYGLEMRARHLTLRYLSGDWPAMASTNAPARGVSSVLAARMTSSWLPFAVARGRVDTAQKYLGELRPHWRAEPLTAIVSGATGAELSMWQGEYEQAIAWVRKVIEFLLSFDEGYLLATVRLGALGVEAAAAWSASARKRGDHGVVEQAVAAGRKLIEHVRYAGANGKPRAQTLGPEGRAWLARAEASASGLEGPADPALWAAAVAAFDYGAVYEQAICRWHHAEALLSTQGDAGLAAKELLAAHDVAVTLRAVPLRDAVREVARRARIEIPGVEPQPAPRPTVDPLTDRERAVLERVALGRTNKQVGEELFISEKTVSVHLSRVMAKLGANRRAEAVAIAYDKGLLT